MKTVRKTKAVKLLLDLFEQRSDAMAVVDLTDLLKAEMNKTTVYRILDKLEQNGILHSFIGTGGIKWYARSKGHSSDCSMKGHPHFQCKLCGKVECLPLNVEFSSIQNHRIESSQILLVGECPECFS